jgi:hypothetical protein
VFCCGECLWKAVLSSLIDEEGKQLGRRHMSQARARCPGKSGMCASYAHSAAEGRRLSGRRVCTLLLHLRAPVSGLLALLPHTPKTLRVVCSVRCVQGNAIGVGRGERLTSTVNACGICGDELKDMSHLGEEVRADWAAGTDCADCVGSVGSVGFAVSADCAASADCVCSWSWLCWQQRQKDKSASRASTSKQQSSKQQRAC